MLRPTPSVNLDLSAEYYFGRSGALTLAIFNKDLKLPCSTRVLQQHG